MYKYDADWGVWVWHDEVNKKRRPKGSGTTTPGRTEQRAKKQWSYLENADPSSKKCLEKHKKALEEAMKRCEAQLASVSSSSSSSSLSSSSSDEEQGALEKAPQQAGTLKKVAKKKPARRSSAAAAPARAASKRRGKQGPRKMAVEEGSLGVDNTAKSLEKDKGPEQPAPTLEKEGDAAALEVLEKAVEEGTWTLVENRWKKDPKGKKTKQNSLEKEEAPLQGQGLEKPLPKKPVVVVDWHNTLEKDDDVSGDNLKMLSSLMEKCQVHILSYVQSTKRENEVLANMWRLPQRPNLHGMSTTWVQTGRGGKCDLAWRQGAIAIFDDSPAIIKECKEWGLEVYAIQTRKEAHAYLGKGEVFATFADAARAFNSRHLELPKP